MPKGVGTDAGNGAMIESLVPDEVRFHGLGCRCPERGCKGCEDQSFEAASRRKCVFVLFCCKVICNYCGWQ